MVTREEFDMLKLEMEALRRLVQRDHAPRIEAVEESMEQLVASVSETRAVVRTLASDVGRVTDLVTPLSYAVPRIERNVSRLVEILEPRTVVVENGK